MWFSKPSPWVLHEVTPGHKRAHVKHLEFSNSETEDLRSYEGFFVLEIGNLVQICALCRQLEDTFDERVIEITSAKFH